MKRSILFFLILFLTSCDIHQLQQTPTSELYFLKILEETCRNHSSIPDYIEEIFPVNNCTYTINDNAFVIKTEINGALIDSCPASDADIPLYKRINLYVDDQLIKITNSEALLLGFNAEDSDGQRLCMLWEGPFFFRWNINISSGFHEARLEIDDNHGNQQIYNWGFEIKISSGE